MKKIKLLIVITLTMLLTGCWDKVELEDRGFVITLGIDKYAETKPNNDENNKKDNNKDTSSEKPAQLSGQNEESRYIVTMALPNVSELSGGNGGGGSSEDGSTKAKSVKKAASETVSGGMKFIDTYSSQKLYYGHLKACIIGKDILNDKELLKEAIDALERNKEISRKLIILAADDTAEKILNTDAPGEPLIGMFVSDFYKNNLKNVGVTFRQDLESIIQQFMAYNNTVIPKVSVENDEIKLGGLAIIKNYELVGWLNDMQTRGYLWINNDKLGGDITAKLDNNYIPMKITNKETKIKFNEKDGKINCNINILVDGNVEEYQLAQSLLFDKNTLENLQAEYENVVKEEVYKTIDILQNNFKTDALGFKELCRKNYYDIYLKYADNWDKAFEEMIVNTNANVCIRNSGATK